MKMTVAAIILSTFVFFLASSVSSNYIADSIVVTDANESAPTQPDSDDQETSKTFPILLSMSVLGLAAVRRPPPGK
jgi:hypothetical protein